MNVLSLFDGKSTGYDSLIDAGIKIKKYYSSEIDKYANAVSRYNHPDIIRLGDVRYIQEGDFEKIDILIGGSPCQGFSVSGKMKGSVTKEGIDVTSLEQYLDLKERGFEFDGQSYLFWEYVRLWKLCKPKYFFLENVRVTKKWLPMFNKAMGVEPIFINSKLLSAQSRPRYYWTNIPNVEMPEDSGIVLKDILEDEVDEKYNAGKHLLKGYKGGNQLNPKYKSQANTIHQGDKSGTICAGTHGYANGYVKTLCDASRGRYLVDGKMLTAGLTTQMMEVRPDEKTNCLTTVAKDNLVVKGLNHGDRVPLLEVKEATKKGFIEVENSNCFDFSVPNSKTRRGRSMKDKSNAILTSNGFMKYDYPIYRKFTPVELERLQTMKDDSTKWGLFEDGSVKQISDSQRTKILGNGWTQAVITHFFKNIK